MTPSFSSRIKAIQDRYFADRKTVDGVPVQELFKLLIEMAHRMEAAQSPVAPPLPPYEPPGDEQIIVWVEDEGKPFVVAIFDELIQPSPDTRHNTYKEFVELVGPAYAETAVRLYQMDQGWLNLISLCQACNHWLHAVNC